MLLLISPVTYLPPMLNHVKAKALSAFTQSERENEEEIIPHFLDIICLNDSHQLWQKSQKLKKSVIPFVILLGPGTSSTLARPFGLSRKGKRQRKNKCGEKQRSLEHNKYRRQGLWWVTASEMDEYGSREGTGRRAHVTVPCSQEGCKDLVMPA